jgi:hypothetical protein
MTRRIDVLKGALAGLVAAFALAGSVPAEAQRDRDWRDNRQYDNRRYDDRRYDDRRYDDRRYDDRYDNRYDDRRYDDRYGRGGRTSMEAIRRLAERAEAESNEFRDLFERLERDPDAYYGDGGYGRGNGYGRDDRYRRDDRNRYDRRDNRLLADLKPYVQRMDEGLERLRWEVGDDRRYSDARGRMSEIMRSARAVDRAFGNGSGRDYVSGSRGRFGSLNSRWVRLRAELNQLASVFGIQRV